MPEVFCVYTDLLKAIEKRGHKSRVLGCAPDGSPVIAVKCGGDRKPAIFIGSGSHATEHAGVVAAVELMDDLKTDHEVWILPCRDPIGLSGFPYALSLALGKAPDINTVQEAENFMREKGEVIYDEDDLLLVQIGEYGYANRMLYRRIEKGNKALEPLRGRRIYFPSRNADEPGAAPLERAYMQVITPDGEVLHMNRFHDTSWAPVEVQCTRRLMAKIDPKLTFDLHEYGEDGFWLSARRQRNDEDEEWELRMATIGAKTVKAAGATFPGEDYLPGTFFEKLEPGVFWLNAQERGEGLNLVDFAARKYGPGFTIETGMRQKLDRRVMLQKTVVQAVVAEFEKRYAQGHA